MKKVLLTIVLCGVIILGLTACGSDINDEPLTLNVFYKDTVESIEIEVGKVLTYQLLTEEYSFKITEITEDDITIEVDKYGLTDSNDLLAEEKEFKIIRTEGILKLHTQTTDYQETIGFGY